MKLLVVGDLIEDRYIFGNATRLCPEAPVPVIVPEREYQSHGGAGLVQQQLVRLGGNEIDYKFMSLSIKKRIFCGPHLVCRIDVDDRQRKPNKLAEDAEKRIAEFDGDAIVVSDYGKGALTQELADKIMHTDKPVFVDAKHHWEWYSGPHTYAFPNEHESLHFSMLDCAAIINKLGAKGCTAYSPKGGTLYSVPATVSEVVDTTGAGDIFMAGFVYAWTLQLPAEDCLKFANEIAGESCRHRGTYVVPKAFAEGVLGRLRASGESQQPSPESSRYSTRGVLPQSFDPDQPQGIFLRENASLDSLRASYPPGAAEPSEEACSRVIEQILHRSPLVPTESPCAPTPGDLGSSDSGGSGLQLEQPDLSSSESEHRSESKSEPGPTEIPGQS